MLDICNISIQVKYRNDCDTAMCSHAVSASDGIVK